MSDNKDRYNQKKQEAKKAAVLGTQKSKKNLLLPIAAVVMIAGMFTWIGINTVSGKGRGTTEDAFVSVSALKAQPNLYQGHITIQGVASRIISDQGVIEISDEKACCSIFLLTPINEEQQSKLKIAELYNGKYPATGTAITASGTLKKEADGYRFVVSKLEQGEHTLLTRQ